MVLRTMSECEAKSQLEEGRSFSSQEADEASRDLQGQIERLREQVRIARTRLSKTAREQARELDEDRAS